MISCRFPGLLSLLAAGLLVHVSAAGQEVSAPAPQPATVIGTVLDVNGGVVPGASATLSSSNSSECLTTISDANGFFRFTKVTAGVDYHVTIRMRGFADWTSKPLELTPGQYFLLTGIQLRLATVQVSVTALTQQQMAAKEVRAEEKQRILGFIPNFFAVYESHPTPLTAKLKFHLALTDLTDPVTLGAFVLNASFYQAGGYPDYRGGLAGYGQRLGSTFAGGYTNILTTEALLPSVLHQDPRFFYRGGTWRSRLLHAVLNPVLTHGDNGRRQFNFSGIGGDLVSGAIANAYYPSQQRGSTLVFQSALIGAGGRIAYGLLDEFAVKHPASTGSN